MEYGTVTTVAYRDGIAICMVKSQRSGIEYGPLPVANSHNSFVEVPKQGDVVILEELAGEKRIVTGFLGSSEAPPNDMKEGDFGIHLDEGTWISFSRNDNGDYDLSIVCNGDLNLLSDNKLELEAGGNISITTAGDLHLNYDGDLYENGTKQ